MLVTHANYWTQSVNVLAVRDRRCHLVLPRICAQLLKINPIFYAVPMFIIVKVHKILYFMYLDHCVPEKS